MSWNGNGSDGPFWNTSGRKWWLAQSPDFASYHRKPQILGRPDLISCRLPTTNMPHCSECGCDLPTFETVCSKCYDARYAGMGRPKHFLESMQQFLANPLRLTAEDLLQEEKVTLPVALACWGGGLLICWFGGLARADFKCSASSDEVFSGALICVLISLGATLALARTNGKLHWRIASTVFAVSSWGVMGFLYIGSR